MISCVMMANLTFGMQGIRPGYFAIDPFRAESRVANWVEVKAAGNLLTGRILLLKSRISI
jgi:hypothetical protein